MEYRSLRPARLMLALAMALTVLACWAARADAYVFWGYSAPTSDSSGIGRANQSGSGAHAREVAISGSHLLNGKSNTDLPRRRPASGIALYGKYVYWGWDAPTSDSAGIGRAKLNGSDDKGTFIPVSGSNDIGGIAVSGSYVYWAWHSLSDDASGIGRAKLNGSDARQSFISFSSSDVPDGLAVNGTYLYWAWHSPTDDSSGIGRAKLSGADRHDTFFSFSSSDEPSGIALNATYVYWAWHSPNDDSSGIGRAKLSGSDRHDSFLGISSSDQPHGLAVDQQYLYWGWNAPTNDTAGIGRANLDGSHIHGTFIGVSGSDQIGGTAVGGPPASTSVPTISGIPKQADILTEKHGGWLNGVKSYGYRWERCDTNGAHCVVIAGAPHQTYKLTAADVGHRIRAQEEAFNASGGSSVVTSAATSVVLPVAPANSSPPTISGNVSAPVAQGATLTEGHGSWLPTPTSYTYQWLDCNAAGAGCTAIAGASAQTYTLTATDIGDTLRVDEWATDAGGSGGPATSAATPVVLPNPPANVTPPSIEGDLTNGQVLTEVQGSWTNGPTTPGYQWFDCNASGADCVAIPGATAQTYTLAGSDVGDTITVQETATNAGGTGGPVSSPATGAVAPTPSGVVGPSPPVSSLAPVISGQGAVGQTLSASYGAWEGTPTLSYTYQWQECPNSSTCSNITGATASTYTVVSAEEDLGIRVVVAATNAASGDGVAADSNIIAIGGTKPPVQP
jgi:hypothetical protein